MTPFCGTSAIAASCQEVIGSNSVELIHDDMLVIDPHVEYPLARQSWVDGKEHAGNLEEAAILLRRSLTLYSRAANGSRPLAE